MWVSRAVVSPSEWLGQVMRAAKWRARAIILLVLIRRAAETTSPSTYKRLFEFFKGTVKS